MHQLTARTALATASALAMTAMLIFSTLQAHAADPAVSYMRHAANALIDAQRKGSAGAFARVINSYGHVPAIALFALGDFRKDLPSGDRRTYYSGMTRFIGRYAATEAPKYPVERVKFAAAGIRDGRTVLVDSQIVLKDGSTYDVRWMLLPNRGGFKVRDAQVLGFWVSPFLQTLFQNYIKENGGNVNALVTVLSRMP
jgi:phospholipid transport system substrate-binding protein